jgi:ABC-type Zn uptake system ZnuABC Zn-binding protein ZnuA
VGFILLAAVVVAGGLWLRSRSQRTSVYDERPLVVATVPHVASWVRNLVGEGARVEVLVGGGAEAHDCFDTGVGRAVAQAEGCTMVLT